MTDHRLPVRHHRLFPGDQPLGEAATMLTIDPEATALLLVDVYHAAADPAARDLVNTAWDRHWWRVVDGNLVPLVRAARQAGVPVVYAMNSSPRIAWERSVFGERLRESLGFDPRIDFAEPTVDPHQYHQGDPVQLVVPPRLAPQPGDFYVRKHTYSGFFETRLDSVLRNLGARTLLCAGFVLDCCVLFTIADAVFRGYRPVLVRDGSLAAELPDEVATLAHTRRTVLAVESFLCPSTTTGDVVDVLAGRDATAAPDAGGKTT